MGWSAGTFTRTNGTYTGASVWASDEAATIDIESARHDTHDQDLAAGINLCIHKGGQNAATANLPMGGFKHTNVANATASGEYVSFSQFTTATYSPTLTPAAGSASAVTVTNGYYTQINKLVWINIFLTWTQSTASTASVDITLPVTPVALNQALSGHILPSGTLVSAFANITSLSGNGTMRCYAYDQQQLLTGAGKQVHIGGVYIAA